MNFLLTYVYSSEDCNFRSLNARSYIVLDRASSTVLYEKNSLNKAKMASTTKIMTCLVILENFDLSTVITVSKKAANTGGSKLGLKPGDKITINDLLYGLMLRSGNDAAICLAESCSGDVSSFCDLMNNKALELSLTNTHFESPHGLDSNEHYTTAYELAILTNYALNNSRFLEIVGTKNYTININGYPKTLSNTNELLGNLNGVYGVKTGFTNGANRCLVTACKRNDMDIICIVLGCDTKNFRTQDSTKLIEDTFKNYQYINIKEKINEKFNVWKDSYSSTLNIEKGIFNGSLNLKIDNLKNEIIPIKKEQIEQVEIKFVAPNQLIAPIHTNKILGYVEVSSGDKVLTTCDIIITETIEHKNILTYLFEILKEIGNGAKILPYF